VTPGSGHHATTIDIQAIVNARNAVLKASLDAEQAQIPTLPQLHTQAQLHTQSIGTPATPATLAPATGAPAVVAEAPVVSDADLAAFVLKSVSALGTSVTQLFSGGFKVTSVLDLIQVVSTMVRDGLPQAKGKDARAIVIALFKAVANAFVVPIMPAFIRPFAPALINMAVGALETIYQAHVKK
jgi:hypothetical protein